MPAPRFSHQVMAPVIRFSGALGSVPKKWPDGTMMSLSPSPSTSSMLVALGKMIPSFASKTVTFVQSASVAPGRYTCSVPPPTGRPPESRAP